MEAYKGGKRTCAGDELERAIGSGDEAIGECNALGFVAIEQPAVRARLQHRRQLPSEVDRVANFGIHALPAQRESSKEVGLVQRHMQLPVHPRPARLHIGDIKEMLVRSAWKPGAKHFAYR